MEQTRGKKYQLLVVDDMKVNYLAITKLLASHPYECHFENKPEQVVEIAEKMNPDAILLDFEMPGMSGPEVCAELKKNSKTEKIPVIFVTSQAGDAEVASAFEAGADDYVLKPARVKELLARLHHSILSRELQKELNVRIEDQTMLTRILSHDINNLITIGQGGIMGLQRLIANSNGSINVDDFNKYISRNIDSLKRIGELVGNVRHLQSIDDHKLELNLVGINLVRTLEEVKTLFQDKLDKKQLSFEVVLPEGTEEILVLAEYTGLLHSVLSNLMSNSIKFSHPNKKISAKVSLHTDKIQLEWMDQGIGINNEMIPKIFSKSEKTTRLGTEKEKGTGFGMPIVKRYIELFSGTIDVSSKSEEEFPSESGTKFVINFLKPKFL